MATVTVIATGQTIPHDVVGYELEYYEGEANTVGGYIIDGHTYPPTTPPAPSSFPVIWDGTNLKANGSTVGLGFVASQLPSDAKANSSTKPYDASRCIYNAKASNLFTYRSARGDAAAGTGHCRVGFIGDSTYAGVTAVSGSGVRGTGDIATLLQTRFAASGYPAQGSGYIPAAGQQADSRVALSGFTNNNPYAKSAANGNTVTFNIPASQTGTAIRLFYLGSSAAFTWTINGTTQTAPVVGKGATMQILEVTGLTAGASQTVVVTASAANAFVMGCVSGAPSSGAGFSFYNCAVSGSGTETNAPWSWTGTAQNFSYLWQFQQFGSALDGTSGQASRAVPMHLVFLGLFINNWNTNLSTTTHKTDMETIINTLKGLSSPPSIVLTAPAAVNNGAGDSTNNGTYTWSAYRQTQYQLADEFDLPLIDLGMLWGLDSNTDVQNWTRANGAGLMTTANPFHPSAKGYAAQAAAFYDLLAA